MKKGKVFFVLLALVLGFSSAAFAEEFIPFSTAKTKATTDQQFIEQLVGQAAPRPNNFVDACRCQCHQALPYVSSSGCEQSKKPRVPGNCENTGRNY